MIFLSSFSSKSYSEKTQKRQVLKFSTFLKLTHLSFSAVAFSVQSCCEEYQILKTPSISTSCPKNVKNLGASAPLVIKFQPAFPRWKNSIEIGVYFSAGNSITHVSSIRYANLDGITLLSMSILRDQVSGDIIVKSLSAIYHNFQIKHWKRKTTISCFKNLDPIFRYIRI